MSIIRSSPHRREKIRDAHSSAELKQFDELFEKLVKKSHEFPSNEVVDTREENHADADLTSDESVTSVCTERKLRRIKRKLFLDVVKGRTNQVLSITNRKIRVGRE